LVCVGVEDSWASEEDEHDDDQDEDRDPDQHPRAKTALTGSARRAWIDVDLTHLVAPPAAFCSLLAVQTPCRRGARDGKGSAVLPLSVGSLSSADRGCISR
jgi:hypothetical protein